MKCSHCEIALSEDDEILCAICLSSVCADCVVKTEDPTQKTPNDFRWICQDHENQE